MKTRLFVSLLTLSTAALFAEPASDASVQRLLQLAKIETMTQHMQEQMSTLLKTNMQRAMHGVPQTPEAQVVVEEMNTRLTQLFADTIGWESMAPLYAQIYKEVFDQEEIDGLIAFYESKAGQAFAEKQPQIVERTMHLSQQRVGDMQGKLQAIMMETATRLRALTEAPSAPAAPDSPTSAPAPAH